MNKKLVAAAILLTLTLGTISACKSEAKNTDSFSVAIVDVQKIVENSPRINALNVDRKNKLADLGKFVEKARADVEKETNAIAKKALEDKYNKELNEKKDAMDKEFFQKLADEDKTVTSLIKSKAKSLGYSLVLTRNCVLDGGTDITDEIIKNLK